jgi:hypothetical protein
MADNLNERRLLPTAVTLFAPLYCRKADARYRRQLGRFCHRPSDRFTGHNRHIVAHSSPVGMVPIAVGAAGIMRRA